ncbi:alpha/beta hydrolase [Bacillus sp. FJAT-44742]|uniref:alpha/beta hydrolase n=1 Tax=Bacillus sp. FJAT-44742 TaxID=2014005 RepID=UPI000C23A8EF|nr:alpha/beta hydrolase [Bacillus sp. FJAT-44742]
MEQWIEKEIAIGENSNIKGTLAIPAKLKTNEKAPAVMIIPGSGPIDRNGNVNRKFTFDVYRELAHYITSLGFITFRYDKRGVGESKGDYYSTGFYDLVDDAQSVFTFLSSHPNVIKEQIIVAGHSEGTIIGTALSERRDLGGLMLLSGSVDNLDQALKGQRQRAYKELMEKPGLIGWLNRKLKIDEKSERKVDKLTARMASEDKDVIRSLFFFKQPAKWLREHTAYDTRSGLRTVSCPVLAMNGDKDSHVNIGVLKELETLVQGEAEYHIIKDMEHGLKEQRKENLFFRSKNL